MYNQFFGLSRPPFAVTPDPGVLYMSHGHREALATIFYGIETRKGFIVCTGEVGTGKTTIVRAFLDQVDLNQFRSIYIFMPQLTRLQMTRFICSELELPAPANIFAGTQRIHLKLLEMYKQGRTVVLMIDEAHTLPVQTLEFLRLLSNFETSSEKLLQIVLVGQPELDNLLQRKDLRQVNQRVAHYVRLDPLSEEDSLRYIEHRLLAAGARTPSEVISASAARTIAKMSDGIPRRINVLADNVLLAAYGVGERPIGDRLTRAAIRQYDNRWRQSQRGLYLRGRWRSKLRPARWMQIGAEIARAVRRTLFGLDQFRSNKLSPKPISKR